MRQSLAVSINGKRPMWSALNEEEAREIAEKYPNRIYFYYENAAFAWCA